ncbi:hypothetical protein Vadar_003376 [Vaccinium darrowii]|uniref:Uncharacterized protein n=1 Tax=Vaccinium darrowii TaxID=229202 RepID=A0ACB7XWI3_9ERIC|nr:hypothetical protein Vadar_003376 [Vaccinium darrowii]
MGEGSEGWNLVTRKRSSGRNFSQAGSNGFLEGRNIYTVFVDNLSEDMDAEWLGQIFSKYGHIWDVFIPKKKSKGFNSKFGFVRYGSMAEAKVAISELNGIFIREKKMFAKLASYSGSKGFVGNGMVRNSKVDQGGVKHLDIGKKVCRGDPYAGPIIRSGNGLSYADVVVGKPKATPKRINIQANPNEWLSRSVVAKLKSLGALESIKEAIHCEGVPEVDVRDMGGLWVVITLPSRDLMLSLFEGGELSWFNNWLDEIKQWSPDLTNTRRRNVWISCYANDSVDELDSKRDVAFGEMPVMGMNSSSPNMIPISCSRVEETLMAPNVQSVVSGTSMVEETIMVSNMNLSARRNSCVEAEAVSRTTSNSKVEFLSPTLGGLEGNKKKEIVVNLDRDIRDWAMCEDGIGPNQNKLANILGAGPSKFWKDGVTNSTNLIDPGISLIESERGLRKSNSLGRSRLKSWEEILGVKETNDSDTGGGRRRRRKTKQVVFRSAAAAVSLTLSSEGIRNRNRILLDEAQAVWTMGKIVGGKAESSENEIISKLVEIEEGRQDERKEARGGVQP